MPKLSDFPNRAAAMEASDDVPLSPARAETIGDVIARRYNRRDVMRGALGVTAATALFGPAALAASKTSSAEDRFTFTEVLSGADETHHVAEGYEARRLLSWGDALHAGMPDFAPTDLTPEGQQQRFGYNNDYIAYFPIEGSSKHGLLCVNHEYASDELMFRGIEPFDDTRDFSNVTREMVEIEMAALGVSVVEVFCDDTGAWQVKTDSDKNRRISATTPMDVDGPAAGNERLKTTEDPSGARILGTFCNCAGGRTPWKTYLTAEENLHYYFWTDQKDDDGAPLIDGTAESHPKTFARYRLPYMGNAWGREHDRFNVDKEPNEPNRFGWIIEIDPFDPSSTPVKHTALGRFFHEGAETVLAEDKRAVVFTGDDAMGEYVYRFVSLGRFVDGDLANNRRLLSDGTLSVAKFHADGTGEWLPLTFGQGKLTEEGSNGALSSQADVLIDARVAADLLEATKMDRPEDVQPNEVTGRVYVMLTNNIKRTADTVDAANPRALNRFGHIIELTPDGGDFAADRFTWDILVRCGDPAKPELGAYWNAETSEHSWFVCPDNAAVDDQGRLWIATDQGSYWQQTMRADGLFALETEGARRGTPRMFFRVPVGAELCGPCFTPDGETLFLSVQHPGADGVDGYAGFEGPSTFDRPATRWPDFKDGMPPRPSVMAITKKGGGKIG